MNIGQDMKNWHSTFNSEKNNFLQLRRLAMHKEQRNRQQFEKTFSVLTFNKELTLSQESGRYAISFHP